MDIDLDAFFAAPQTPVPGSGDNTSPQVSVASTMPPGALIKINFKPQSLLSRALAAMKARGIQKDGSSIPQDPSQQQQQQDNFIHGLVINHTIGSSTIQIRLYDLDKPYNVQSQSMMLINLDDVETLEFVAMIQNNLLVEPVSQDFVDVRIAAAAERRLKLKQLINPYAGQYGQDLAIHLSKTLPTTRWFNLNGEELDDMPAQNYPNTPYSDTTTIVIDKMCIVRPYSPVNVMTWDTQQKRPIPSADGHSNHFLVHQIEMFESEYRKTRPDYDFKVLDAEIANGPGTYRKERQAARQEQKQQQQQQQQQHGSAGDHSSSWRRGPDGGAGGSNRDYKGQGGPRTSAWGGASAGAITIANTTAPQPQHDTPKGGKPTEQVETPAQQQPQQSPQPQQPQPQTKETQPTTPTAPQPAPTKVFVDAKPPPVSAWADPNSQKLDLGQNTSSTATVEPVVPAQQSNNSKKGEGKSWNHENKHGEGKQYKPKEDHHGEKKPNAAQAKVHKDSDGFISRR